MSDARVGFTPQVPAAQRINGQVRSLDDKVNKIELEILELKTGIAAMIETVEAHAKTLERLSGELLELGKAIKEKSSGGNSRPRRSENTPQSDK